jgi:hypothetical protein
MGRRECWDGCGVVSYVLIWALLLGSGIALMLESTTTVCVPCAPGYNKTFVNGADACISPAGQVGGNPCVQHRNEAEYFCAILLMVAAACMIGGPTLFYMDGNGDAFVV